MKYTDKTLLSPDQIECRVLDIASVDFMGALQGRKSSETLVRLATGDECLETKNRDGQVESVYETKAGDAIFINLHNPDDQYVPGKSDGSRMQFADLSKEGYEIVGDDFERGGVRVKSAKIFSILHEAVQHPTAILNAWGPDQHQFLFAGATLKRNDDGCNRY